MKSVVDRIALMDEAATSPVEVSSADLESVKKLARRLLEVEREINDHTMQLALLVKEREKLRIRELPEVMSQLRITSIGIDNRVVEIDSIVEARPPKDPTNWRKTIEILTDMKEAGGIKRSLQVDLPKGDAVAEEKVLEALRALDITLNPIITASIHWKTYQSIIERLIRAGCDLPKDTMGIFVGHMARVVEE
jgi:hypothetical protein